MRLAALLLLLVVVPAHAESPLDQARRILWPHAQAQAAQDSPAVAAPLPEATATAADSPAASPRDPALPDLSLTPGVVTTLTVQEICARKWGKDARAVTAAMKRQVFAAYGMTGNADPACVPDAHGRRCEIDHLVSRELGGADDVQNLWPQPYGTQPWNATRKDRVENRLHKEVCAGRLALEQARAEIVADWRVPYRRYFGEPQ